MTQAAEPSSMFRSKSEVVVEGIRSAILSGEFSAGHELKQRDLAARFGVSPTPVREALRQLEAEGYVASKLHHGAVVVRTEEARISENSLIRATLEGLAVELAARKITPATIKKLEDLNEKLAHCRADSARRLELNRKLHFTIYRSAESPILESLLTLLWDSLDEGEGPGRGRPLNEALEDHSRIIEALRAGDGRAAVRHIREHIEHGRPAEARTRSERAG
jgi:DNA-binding GntR family transcriptional regulator